MVPLVHARHVRKACRSPGSQRRPWRPDRNATAYSRDGGFLVRSYAVMTSVSCAMSLRGTGGVSACSVPHLKPSARDFGLPSKQRWPRRGRGMGDAPGPTTGPIAQRISVSRKGTKQPGRPICRLASRRVRQRTEAVCPPRNILKREIVQPRSLHLGFATRSGCLSRSASFRSHAACACKQTTLARPATFWPQVRH